MEIDWSSALDLKLKSKSEEAATALEAFAKNYPKSEHASDALVEAGVNWFVIGKAKQALHQNTPEALQAFDRALAHFSRVAAAHDDAAAPRAQFMRGSTHLVMGKLDLAEQEFGVVVDQFKADKKYYGKALERRAAARRNQLKTDLALADLKRYQSDVGDKGDEAEVVKRFLGYTLMFGKPAPALDVESWIQGEPTTLAKMRGDIVAVYFFATWCPVCAKEKDHVLDVVARYEPMGVKFVGVITHAQGTSAETAKPFLATNKYNFPVIMDRGATVGAFQSGKIPDLVLIDRAGNVRWHDNPANFNDSTLESLLTEDPSAAGTSTSTQAAKPH
jgi:thiol-disulfide isomerase/thioredoxin